MPAALNFDRLYSGSCCQTSTFEGMTGYSEVEPRPIAGARSRLEGVLGPGARCATGSSGTP
jgi:hypothetical protein